MMEEHHRTPDGPVSGPLVPHEGSSRARALSAASVPADPLFDDSAGAVSGAPPGAPFQYGLLLRHKWLALIVFLVVAGAGVPLVWTMYVPQYKAGVAVRVRPVLPRIVFNTDDGVAPIYRVYLNTQVAIIRSPQVLERVLDRQDVIDSAWYHDKPKSLRMRMGGSAPSRLERLRDAVETVPRPHTELVDVVVSAPDPRSARIIANAVVSEYLQYTKEEAADEEELRFNTLRRERDSLEKAIDGLVEVKGNLSKQMGTGDPDIVRAQTAERLNALEARREELQRAYHMAQDDLAGRRAEMEASGGAGADSALGSRYAEDVEWRGLNARLRTAEHQLSTARDRYGESHPRIRQLLAEVEHAREMLSEREGQLDELWLRGPGGGVALGDGFLTMDAAGLERLIARQSRELELLDEQIRVLRTQQERQGELAKEIAKYDQQLVYRHELYSQVHKRLDALQMEEKAPGRIAVASYAVEPTAPSSDRRPLLTIMVLGAAALAGVGLAFVRLTLDTRIREGGDVRHAARVPFLGQVPRVRSIGGLTSEMPPLLLESIRMVRTALLERLGAGRNTVLISSAHMKAGKSTLSVLLARSLAAMGKNVLLVEADLYRPALADRLGVQGREGLADVLNGRLRDDAAIRGTGVRGFDILLAGSLEAGFDHDRLAAGHLAPYLKRWKKAYDYVLLDGPPVAPVADARILASQADGVLMVLRASQSKRDEVVQAYADLSAAGGTLVGTVLVGTSSGRGYGGYGGYGSYDGYLTDSGDGPPKLEARESGIDSPKQGG